MKVKIKDYEYEIVEVDAESVEFKSQAWGKTDYNANKIYLDKDMNFMRKKYTLLHELFHAFTEAYGHNFDNGLIYSNEHLCDIGAMFCEDIIKIVDEYFNIKRNEE